MKLVGMIRLPRPTILDRTRGPAGDSAADLGEHIAFDDEGGGWLLVERIERIGGGMGRRVFVRWHALAALPFVTDDPIVLFEDDEPSKQPGPVDPDGGDIDEGRDG
jgi:hypothetical protein